MAAPRSEALNILFVTDSANMYGAERCLLEVVSRMGPAWRPCFATPRAGRLTEELSRANFPVYTLNLEAEFRSPYKARRLLTAVRLASLIWSHRIHLVHLNLHFEASIVAGACALAGVPVVVHVRNMVDDPLGPLVHNVDGFICISKAVRDSLISVGKLPAPLVQERSWLIPDGRDLAPYGRANRTLIRKELELEDDTPLVGMVARLCSLKGQDVFLEMAASVSDRIPSARFLLVGDLASPLDTGYETTLKRLQRELGLGDKVTFAGYRDDIPDLLAAMDCFVHPSRRGAFVSVLIEAMASGVPIVASDVDGIPECVGRNGAAILISPVTPASYSDAVVKVLIDRQLAARMAAAGRERAQKLYHIGLLTEETTSMFKAVLQRSSFSQRLRRVGALLAFAFKYGARRTFSESGDLSKRIDRNQASEP